MSLRSLMDVLAPDLRRASARMWRSLATVADYRAWLAVSHDLVRATGPLLSEALGESVRRGEPRLTAYFAAQAAEENAHDAWLRDDYAATGGDPRDLLERVPCPAAARLAGAQHYYLRHTHPVTLLGHIAVLEWNPPDPGLAPRLAARVGLPAEAFRTLARHAELDTGHGAALDRLLAELPLDERRRRLLTTSALTTAHGLVELLSDWGAHP
jgi:hypothetical protein